MPLSIEEAVAMLDWPLIISVVVAILITSTLWAAANCLFNWAFGRSGGSHAAYISGGSHAAYIRSREKP